MSADFAAVADRAAGRPVSARAAAGLYVATVRRAFDPALIAGLRAPTPFQSQSWLASWYGALSGSDTVAPLLVEARDRAGDVALVLPLVINRSGALKVIEFADYGITDYNLPLLGPAAPATPAASRAAWAAIRAALPPADLLALQKMPETIDGAINPLVAAMRCHPANLVGSFIAIGEDHQAWLASLDRKHRKEMGRFWRVFTREKSARFVRAERLDEAARIFDWIEASQSRRAGEIGLDYRLDQPQFREFYRAILEGGLGSGEVVVTALMAGDTIVAGLFAIGDGRKYTMLRIATAGGEWSNCSPGRLVIERSIHAMHARGYRWFDFAIGDYQYKRSFETTQIALAEAFVALSPKGLAPVALIEAKAFVKRNPALERLARRAMAITGRGG